jgi:hypothetical protein
MMKTDEAEVSGKSRELVEFMSRKGWDKGVGTLASLMWLAARCAISMRLKREGFVRFATGAFAVACGCDGCKRVVESEVVHEA